MSILDYNQLLNIEKRDIDIKEERVIEEFVQTGCNCGCSKLFSKEYYATIRAQCQELSKDSLELVVMGFLMGAQAIENQLNTTITHRPSSQRQRHKASFHHRGHKVCLWFSCSFSNAHCYRFAKSPSYLCTPSLTTNFKLLKITF